MPETDRHPFLRGLSKHRGAPPTIMVIFGASGDLTQRKLLPALYNLSLDSLLPTSFRMIGFGRSAMAGADFVDRMREALEAHSRRPINQDLWERLAVALEYQSGSYDDPEAYQSLGRRIASLEEEAGREMQLICYISTPPGVFQPIVENLGRSGLAKRHAGTRLATRVIVEKPFGRDLESARHLNRVLAESFDEHQVYRIDHYLGKETVQNLLVQRFANAIFEPIWNRQYVDCVQITVAESIGVEGRGGYYDHSGAVRDMIQNHTMQLFALTAMEPPVSLHPESIRDEKVKVLKAVQPLRHEGDHRDVVRAQYGEGLVGGAKAAAYRDEPGIPHDSCTETYGALRLMVNNWRWQGVPFYLRSGKRMARRASEIAVQFKQPPGILFTEGRRFDVAPNTLVIQVQPDEGITLLTNSKIPGLETRTQPVRMHFRYATTFGSNTPEAYERLILDAMVGDSTLFIRGDETEASWKLITPILDHWESARDHQLETYASGSWGPLAADRLLWEHRHEWRRPGA